MATLTAATGKVRQYDGLKRRMPLPVGVEARQLALILAKSASVSDAADLVIEICEGREPSMPSDAIGAQEVESKIKQGVQDGVQAALAALGIDEEALALLKSGEGKVRRKPGRKPKIRKDIEPKVE